MDALEIKGEMTHDKPGTQKATENAALAGERFSSVLPEMVQSLKVSGFQALAIDTLPKSGCTAPGQKGLLTYTRLWALAL